MRRNKVIESRGSDNYGCHSREGGNPEKNKKFCLFSCLDPPIKLEDDKKVSYWCSVKKFALDGDFSYNGSSIFRLAVTNLTLRSDIYIAILLCHKGYGRTGRQMIYLR